MKYYKIVSKFDDGLWSWLRPMNIYGRNNVRYEPGFPVVAPEGRPLFVFDNYDSLQRNCGRCYEQWECEIEPSDIDVDSYCNYAPIGTVLASKVTLTKCIRQADIEYEISAFEDNLRSCKKASS